MSPVDTTPCGGCHSGDFADFDHYCDVNNIAMEDTGIAFAVWLHHLSGGTWDGDAGPVDNGSSPAGDA